VEVAIDGLDVDTEIPWPIGPIIENLIEGYKDDIAAEVAKELKDTLIP